jgi:Tfp pilus assembly protein PilN
MRCKINLLPDRATAAKKRRKQIRILTVAQAVIFLLLAAFFIILTGMESRTRETAQALQESTADPAPAALAEQLQQAQSAALEEEYLLEMIPQTFAQTALAGLIAATPENATLTNITYRQNELTLTAATAQITAAEAHRANLAKIFPYVWTGRITRTAEAAYTYEIHIFAGESP